MYYKDYITLNNKFNKSTNIIYDSEDCENYIITTSAKNTLKVLFKLDYHNSISIIGPFGSGKSSLLLYINTLLSDTNYSKICLEKLKKSDSKLYKQFELFSKNKKFLRIKIVGEHSSFKEQFRSEILNTKELKQSIKYLKENESYQFSKILTLIDKDLESSNFTDILFSIDEFGKFIEYSLDNIDSNDIFELQTLAEYINKKSNYKLIVSLHKTFNQYTQNSNNSITYSDWDKIQGRFENIVFKDDYYEMLNIFKGTISHKKSDLIDKLKKIVERICKDEISKKNINGDNIEEVFKQIVPLHPYAVLVIAEVFSKYFQNQRSIYSFIFSSEPSAFQEFLDKELSISELYSLSNLYDYISYLLKVYTIQLPDDEIWYLSEHRIKDKRIESQVQVDIIKSISIIHSFKLTNTVSSDKKHLILALLDKYSENEVQKGLEYLENINILVYQEQTKSYSLLEDSNIDINKELKNTLMSNYNFDYESKLNDFITDKTIVAKRYFVKYGNKKEFEKIYVSKSLKRLNESYKVFLVDSIDTEIKSYIDKNEKSIFIPLENISRLHELIEKIDALNIILENFKEKISVETNDIIQNMIEDSKQTLENLFNSSFNKSTIYTKDIEEKYSSQNLQKILNSIVEKNFNKTPIINNYNLNHTISNNAGTNTTYLKYLFKELLENPDKENLGFIEDKFPAEKALYLSVIKPSGIHTFTDGKYKLVEPTGSNFQHIWKDINKFLKKKVYISDLIVQLQKEPYGLDRTKALFIISLYIIVHRDMLNIYRENSYIFDLSLDMIMNIWKATDKFEMKQISISKSEQELFEAYIEITKTITEENFTRENISSIINTLYKKFNGMPEYTRQTQKLSQKAIDLRRALISVREPIEAFFKLFPNALGYKNIENIKKEEFIESFRIVFNEIALSYKKEILELEKYIASVFLFKSSSFPFDNSLIEMAEKLSKIDSLDYNSKSIVRCFTYSNSIVDLVDGLCVILIRKKISQCYDDDIIQFKEVLAQYAQKLLSKLELTDIVQEDKDIRKISLTSLDDNLNKIITINKSDIDMIDEKVSEIKSIIPSDYTEDQKLYLISQLLNKELNNGK